MSDVEANDVELDFQEVEELGDVRAEENFSINNNTDLKPETMTSNILFIARYPNKTTAKDIEDFLYRFGKVISVTFEEDHAFAEFEMLEDAVRAKNELHNRPGMGTKRLVVDFKKKDLFQKK